MAQSKQALKLRIRSVKATMKITGAMELIANSKLIKQRTVMEKNREYAAVLKDVITRITIANPELKSRYRQAKQSKKRAVIVFTSDFGFCGAYNVNVLKFLKTNYQKDDYIYLIGTKLYQSILNEGYKIQNAPIESDDLSYESLIKLVETGVNRYLADEIYALDLLYTRFVNMLTFTASVKELLPFKITYEAKYVPEYIFEPKAEELYDELVLMTVKNLSYATSLETKTAEQAARRLAMENANDNAEELKDQLILAYNQARQAAITQEISEIVSGAEAL